MSAEFYMVFSTYTQSFSVVRAKSSSPCELALLVFFLSFCVADRFTGPQSSRSQLALCCLSQARSWRSASLPGVIFGPLVVFYFFLFSLFLSLLG
jgi:hypothetical protein